MRWPIFLVASAFFWNQNHIHLHTYIYFSPLSTLPALSLLISLLYFRIHAPTHTHTQTQTHPPTILSSLPPSLPAHLKHFPGAAHAIKRYAEASLNQGLVVGREGLGGDDAVWGEGGREGGREGMR